MNNISKLAAVIAAISITGLASGAKITGIIAFTGTTTLNGSVATATTFTSFSDVVVANFTQTGDYLGTDGSAVTMSPFTFDPALAPSPVSPLWTFISGLTTYSFRLDTITEVIRDMSGPIDKLTVSGRGLASATGFDDAIGDWTLTTQGGTSRISFSSAAAVPEGGTTAALLGLGLIGLVSLSRRFKR